MKAVVYTTYGPPEILKIAEVEKPRPKDNEILIKIEVATVTSGDVRLRGSDFPPLFWLPARLIFGLFRPKKQILGHELSGTVEAIGSKVTQFKVGDTVLGTTTMLRSGSHAEYVCLPESWKQGVVIHKPKKLSFKEAAALPVGGMAALFLLKKTGLKKGMNVLIYGASGSVGSYALQIAKAHGATVTTVSSGANFDMLQSLGADAMIDYKKEDYTATGYTYDLVFDAVGKTSKSQAKKVLNPNGTFVSITSITAEKTEQLQEVVDLTVAGKIKPFIDKEFSLDDIVYAHRYVETGRKRGNIIIRPS
ncbi:MAG: NAD(P)-dependent alcohol dehydrogenase [Bacteroidota bacterium]